MTPQELKNSILQLAIQGKLVEQRPEEGTAEELYQRLKPHYQDLKPCKTELDFSSMDFDIPESWRMVELNQIFNFVDYRGKTPTKLPNGIFLVTASNIKQGFMDYTRKEYISQEEYDNRKTRGVTKKGDLLFTTEAPMGNAALCNLNECSCGQRIITFQEYQNDTVVPALFMYFILSPQFQKQLLNNCTGTTAKGIKADKLKHFYIPLPPFSEQKRIVAKIEELLPYIGRYERAWNHLEDFNKRFPMDMQKSILQLAMQGKLLAQQPEDWKYIRFGDAITLLSGTDFRPDEYNDKGKGIPYITGASSLSSNGVLVNRWTETPRNIAELGDVLLVCKGSGYGKTVICDVEQAHIARQIMAVKKSAELDMKYVRFFLMANLAQIKAKGQGVIPGIDRKSVLDMVFPFPPLAEQKRIVAKLEELLPLCERLEMRS